MPKKKSVVHQINIKIDEDDLNFIDAKSKRHGLSRSGFFKLVALNADFHIELEEKLRFPKI